MSDRLRRLAKAAQIVVLAFALAPGAALAADLEAAQLEAKKGKALRYSLKTVAPESPIDTGGAAIIVEAPIARVRSVVTDFGAYDRFLEPFDESRVLSSKDGVTEIYLSAPVLHGVSRIWAVVEASDPVADDYGEVVAVKFKRGNVDDLRAVWRMRSLDANRTVLKLELYCDPRISVPNSFISTGLRGAAGDAVTLVKARAQKQEVAGKR